MWRLWKLAVGCENKENIARAGGMDLILAATKNHPQSAEVQANACGALLKLAVNDANKKTIARAGGIDFSPGSIEEPFKIG